MNVAETIDSIGISIISRKRYITTIMYIQCVKTHKNSVKQGGDVRDNWKR